MTLRQLLDQSAGFDAEYGHNLASHLPMALTALARLGAADGRLAEFAERYSGRLHPAPPSRALARRRPLAKPLWGPACVAGVPQPVQ